MSKRHAAAAPAPNGAANARPPPSVDMLPDDLILKIEPHVSDVLLPHHLGRFASTSKAMRQLLAERLAALSSDVRETPALLRKCGMPVERVVKERPEMLSFFDRDLQAADAPVLGRVLRSEATAQLKILYLGYAQLHVEIIAAINTAAAGGGLKQLKDLSILGSRSMGDEGMQRLAVCLGDGGLPRLDQLDVGGNSIGDAGAAALAEALAKKKAPSLKNLNLSDNKIGDEGVKALMATAAKGKLATLACLNLEDNLFGEAGADILADTITSCRTGGSLPELKALIVPVAHEGNAKLQAMALVV